MNTPSDLSAKKAEQVLNISRTMKAARAIVFKAWTDQKQLAQWWGPRGFTNPVCELDARPGGAIHIEMRGPDGTRYPMKGIVHEITWPERLVTISSAFEDEKGEPRLEVRNTVLFVGMGDRTKVMLTAAVIKATAAAAEAVEGMETGWNQSLDRLEEFLAGS
jgi:uncharacterized protein YndB with AHSA1/START domain